MHTMPFTVLPFPSATPDIRQVVAGLLQPGGKMSFARFCHARRDVGIPLIFGFAQALAHHAETLFGEPAIMGLPAGTLRYHGSEQADFAPWHTDAWFFRGDGRGLTFWVTFDDVGETAPGVEFQVGDRTVSPRVPAGHALMFGPHVRHRTQTIHGDRISVEFRCVPASMRVAEWQNMLQARVDRTGDGCRVAISAQGRTQYLDPPEA
jgi:hypothetical protein